MLTETMKNEFYALRKKILELEFGRLNDMQKEAVFHLNGPLLILAGAGSGKTSVLTNRIAYMIKYGNAYHSDYYPQDLTEEDLQLLRDFAAQQVNSDSGVSIERINYLLKERTVFPSNILAITFTNKAAKEMKERVEKLLGSLAESIWVSTFHSTCVRILRRDIDKIGFDRSFVIYDMSDQQTLMKDCIKDLNLNDKNFPPRAMLDFISKAKDELIEPSTYMKMHEGDFKMSKVAKLYELYQKRLKQNNALDFDDIIVYTITLFLDNPPVLEYYQKRFRYVLVDEYQDTNTAQYSLISLISQGSRNLCVVGDDDQSIYAFRGANIRNILDFEKEFTDCKVVKLEQNYRSTKTILNAANHVILNNMGRKKKKLWTENDDGHLICCYTAENEHDEAFFVGKEIRKLCDNEKRQYKDFAVLYRMNAQSRVLEDILMKNGIPYKIVGGLRFYDRKEIKDILAYLRVILNPADNIALKRIINVPRRGIGNTTLDSAEGIANEQGCSIFTIISSANEIPELRRAAAKLESFTTMISKFRAFKDIMKITELIDEVIQQSGILKELEDEKTEEGQSRIENIKEFKSVSLEFEKACEQDTEIEIEEQGLEGFLANVSLVADIDSVEEGMDRVVLMTLHSAKGLEFPTVFMVGMEEGVFPGLRSMFDENDIEEERRLCYVGITRAKQKLYMTNAHCRTLFGNTTYNKESRYKREIPQDLMDALDKRKKTEPVAALPRKENDTLLQGGFGFPRMVQSVAAVEKKVQGGGQTFSVGDNVEHKKFGVGVVTSVEKENGDFKLEIQFVNSGMKRLMAAFANLNKV